MKGCNSRSPITLHYKTCNLEVSSRVPSSDLKAPEGIYEVDESELYSIAKLFKAVTVRITIVRHLKMVPM